MERRKFVKTGLLGGLGICIIPISSIGNSVDVKSFSSTNVVVEGHVRHGLYNPHVGAIHHLAPWFKNFKKDVFHKNGISASTDDLINVSFELDKNKISIHKLEESFLIISESGNRRVDFEDSKELTIFENQEYACRLFKFEKTFTLSNLENHFLHPICNSIKLGAYEVDENEIVQISGLDRSKSLTVRSVENTTTVLILTKK